jgi:hypothetical protein
MIRLKGGETRQSARGGSIPQRIHLIKQNGFKFGLNFTQSSSAPQQQSMSNNVLKNNNEKRDRYDFKHLTEENESH